MQWSDRGGPPLTRVCEKHGARVGYRLRVEYVPGPPPFPDSPEEAEWLAARETLVVTVLGLAEGCRVDTEWTRAGETAAASVTLAGEAVAPWRARVESAGGWTLPELAQIRAGTGHATFAHESYEYHDQDPDSLDLDAWQAPRYWRAERGRDERAEEATRALAACYRELLPGGFEAGSALAPLFRG